MAWNRPTANHDIRKGHGFPRRASGIAYALAATLFLFAAVFLGWKILYDAPGQLAPVAKAEREMSAIREVAPAKARQPEKVEALEVIQTNEIIHIGEKAYDLTRLRRDNPQLYAHVTNERARVEAELEKQRRSPVKGLAEQLLALTTPAEKGEATPPIPISEEEAAELEREADKMLSEIPKVEDHDTELSIEIKNKLIALKEEFLAAREQGMSFYDFIRKRQERAQDDAAHLQDAIRLNEETYNDETVSDKDYEATRKKIDKLLKLEGYKGLPPLTEEQAQSAEKHADQQTEEAK